MEVHKTTTQIRYIAWKTITRVYVYFFPNVEQDVSDADKKEVQQKYKHFQKEYEFKVKPGYDNIPDSELENN